MVVALRVVSDRCEVRSENCSKVNKTTCQVRRNIRSLFHTMLRAIKALGVLSVVFDTLFRTVFKG